VQTDQLGLELEHAVDGLITQCKQLSKSPFGTNLSLAVSAETLFIHSPCLSLEVETNATPGLALTRRSGRDVLAIVLDSFSAHVGDVTDFELEVYYQLATDSPILSGLRSLIKEAESVKSLTLTPHAISCFFTDSNLQASSSSAVSPEFFPCLETISMSSFSFSHISVEKDDKFLSLLRTFVMSRPTISTFLVTNESEEIFNSVRECLHDINEDLKIEWKKPSLNRVPNTAITRILEDEGSMDALSLPTEVLKM